jgi:predicted dehydrogenase
MDLMIHDLDLVLALIREDPVLVSAVGVQVLTSSCDMANVRLEFPGGAVANLTASRVSSRAMRKFRVFSSDTYASMDFTSNSVNIYRRRDGEGIEHRVMERVGLDALREQALQFVRSVQGVETPAVSGQDGLRALMVAGVIREKIRERMAGASPPPPSPREIST